MQFRKNLNYTIFEFRFLSFFIPRNFVFIVSSMNSSAHFIAHGAGTDHFGVNFTNFIFSVLKLNDQLEANYLHKLMQNLFYV